MRAWSGDNVASGPPSLQPPSGGGQLPWRSPGGTEGPAMLWGAGGILEVVHIFTATSQKSLSQNHPTDLLPNRQAKKWRSFREAALVRSNG